MKIFDNNKTSIILIRDQENQNRIKHINVMHYYVQDLVKKVKPGIKLISSLSMFANAFTKTFLARLFKKH